MFLLDISGGERQDPSQALPPFHYLDSEDSVKRATKQVCMEGWWLL